MRVLFVVVAALACASAKEPEYVWDNDEPDAPFEQHRAACLNEAFAAYPPSDRQSGRGLAGLVLIAQHYQLCMVGKGWRREAVE